jgi:hypothetical protein
MRGAGWLVDEKQDLYASRDTLVRPVTDPVLSSECRGVVARGCWPAVNNGHARWRRAKELALCDLTPGRVVTNKTVCVREVPLSVPPFLLAFTPLTGIDFVAGVTD